ncbi:MAG: hypothetical protein JW761_12080 [Prolixibacteraceae bacterium]|nr:hypothetical protein [Prolixibacteraceae bacterium]
MNRAGFWSIAIVLFWAGFVSSISFMEAWLKFQAPGVTLPVGLSIGKMIFNALNRVEWFLLIGYSVLFFGFIKNKSRVINTVSLVLLGTLIVQTFFLLPRLSERADIIINGGEVGKSFLHIYFGSLEIVKVAGLLYLGYLFYRRR